MHKFRPSTRYLRSYSYVLCFFYLNEIHTDNKFNSEYSFSYHLLLQEIFPLFLVIDFTYNLPRFPVFYLFLPVPLVVVDEASRLYEACHV